MRFRRYGIDLERLEAKHLEMVRQWRNLDSVRLRMQCQQEISPEMQTEWFKKLSIQNDWYFVAVQQELPFGLFHIKKVNWQKKIGEAGGFVGYPKLIGQIEPGMAILALMDFAFLDLCLDFLEAKYYPGHKDIALLNRQLGYEILGDEPDGFVRARVSTGNYFKVTEKLRKAAEQLRGGYESR
jgi:hypothetical protein